jgi:hypothetical protein
MKLHWASARKQAPSGIFKVEAEPDVRVHVRARVVEVQRSDPGIGTVVPVPKADRNALTELH